MILRKKMNKLHLMLSLALIWLLNMGAFLSSYNYVTQEEFRQWLIQINL